MWGVALSAYLLAIFHRSSLAVADHLSRVEPEADFGLTITSGRASTVPTNAMKLAVSG